MNAPLIETNPKTLRKNDLYLDVIKEDPVLVDCYYSGPQIIVVPQEFYLGFGCGSGNGECAGSLGCAPHAYAVVSMSTFICRIYRPVVNNKLLLAYRTRTNDAYLKNVIIHGAGFGHLFSASR